MNTFWIFEKASVVEFMAKRPEHDIVKFLNPDEQEALRKDLRYGTIEYLSDSLSFKPNKEHASIMEITIFLADDNPRILLKKLLRQIRTPYSISVDFWCIGETINGLKAIYPSFGTCINKMRYMKHDKQVDQLIQSLDPKGLKERIFEAHAKARPTVSKSGVGISKELSLWVRILKNKPLSWVASEDKTPSAIESNINEVQ